MNHILVIGGTGSVGSQVLSQLSGKGARVRAMAGPQSSTQSEQLAIIGRVIRSSLRMEEISPDEAWRELLGLMPLPVNQRKGTSKVKGVAEARLLARSGTCPAILAARYIAASGAGRGRVGPALCLAERVSLSRPPK